jgi:glutathione S-transferase
MIEVYGNNHSPWVQAVLLGLHEKDLAHTVIASPPLKVFLKWGVLMPAARIDGDDWQIESSQILHRLGFSEITREEQRQLMRAWGGVIHRADNPFRFFYRFSLASDLNRRFIPRTVRNFLRSFVVFYFFSLITFARRIVGVKMPDNFGDQFLYWEDRINKSGGEFIGGAQPDALDCLLFGIVQCHTSIPVPPIAAMQEDERLDGLRHWIASMQSRFDDYPYLYSRVYFEPKSAAPKRASIIDQCAFWLGVILMFLTLPITLPLVILLRWRLRRNRK